MPSGVLSPTVLVHFLAFPLRSAKPLPLGEALSLPAEQAARFAFDTQHQLTFAGQPSQPYQVALPPILKRVPLPAGERQLVLRVQLIPVSQLEGAEPLIRQRLKNWQRRG